VNPVLEARVPVKDMAAASGDEKLELIAQAILDVGGDYSKPPLGRPRLEGGFWIYRCTPLLSWLPPR
jgi:hypothetical protein